jgi:hypothetical protein
VVASTNQLRMTVETFANHVINKGICVKEPAPSSLPLARVKRAKDFLRRLIHCRGHQSRTTSGASSNTRTPSQDFLIPVYFATEHGGPP